MVFGWAKEECASENEAAFDGLGRRVVKTVSNSGDLDGVTEYYHNSDQIIETRDGSGNLETQVYHGTQYIDEVVGQRIADMGRVYVHQDANYNVTGTTDLTARQIERNYYSPYGQLEVAVDSHPFDYDDDGDVDADDFAVTTNGTCTGTATGDCRRMDADADGDVDSADQTAISDYIDSLTIDTELARIPAATESQRGNPFGHQGLVFDAEIASYQNRARQHSSTLLRFLQLDPLIVRESLGIPYQDGMNAFLYVGADPISGRDPSGMDQAGCDTQSQAKDIEDAESGDPLKLCGLRCCAEHDQCMSANNCRFLTPTCACTGCNVKVVACFVICIFNPNHNDDEWLFWCPEEGRGFNSTTDTCLDSCKDWSYVSDSCLDEP